MPTKKRPDYAIMRVGSNTDQAVITPLTVFYLPIENRLLFHFQYYN